MIRSVTVFTIQPSFLVIWVSLTVSTCQTNACQMYDTFHESFSISILVFFSYLG